MRSKPSTSKPKVARRPSQSATTPTLLAGGNPQIAKADGDAPVQAYIAAMPGWKRDVGRRLDALIVRNVPGVRKAEQSLVGVCLERSWKLPVVILGTLRAGGAYVPLDPAYPAERLSAVVGDAKARAIVTHRKFAGLFEESGAHVLCVEDIQWRTDESGTEPSEPETDGQGADFAYVM